MKPSDELAKTPKTSSPAQPQARVVELPDGGGTMLARLGPGGAVIRVEKFVELDPAKKHVVSVTRYGEGGQRVSLDFITAAGYYYLNRVAGVHVATPSEVVVDGRPQLNPHVEIDNHGQIRRVTVRKIAIGRGPTGNLVAVDGTHVYMPQQVLVRSLLRKWRGDPRTPVAEWGELVASPGGAAAGRLAIPYAMGLVLSVDLRHKDVISVLVEYAEVQFYAVRVASTVCERNVLKKHPAIAASVLTRDANGRYIVPIVGWLAPDREVDELEDAVRSMSHQTDRPLAHEQVHVEKIKISGDVADDETIDAEVASVADEDIGGNGHVAPVPPAAPEPVAVPTPAEPAAQRPDREAPAYTHADLPALRKRFRSALGRLGAPRTTEILQSLGIRSIPDLATASVAVIGTCVDELELIAGTVTDLAETAG